MVAVNVWRGKKCEKFESKTNRTMNEYKMTGWVVRDEQRGDKSNLYLGIQKPERLPGTPKGYGVWCGFGEFMALPEDMFPELTYQDEPIEVDITIKRKSHEMEQNL